MRNRDARARARTWAREPRDKPAEREAQRLQRESRERWLAEQPGTRIDGMGRPFGPGT